jgi:endonuclease G
MSAAKGSTKKKHTKYAKASARKKRRTSSRSRRIAFFLALFLVAVLFLWGYAGSWFVHHSRSWIARHCETWPRIVTAPLLWMGNPVADITDALGWTGHDAVYEYDTEAPEGEVAFAGLPRRVGSPAPGDIRILDRGEFKIGWSDRLRHPVWVAYHVPALAPHKVGPRPNFRKDRDIPASPPAGSYDRSGYDRGHMAPNFAIASRFGESQQRETFLMSNIAPQSPSLNRGVWRNVEHRIAELWTERWGEIWVVVGCVSPTEGHETLSGTDIDVPEKFYQVVVAQDGLDVRAFAVVFDQSVPYDAWPTRSLITIDELEEMTGLDFLPDLPDFIQRPLESELPSRLWPIRPGDIFKHIALRFR